MNTDMSRRQFVGLAGSLATVLGLGLVGCGGGAGKGSAAGSTAAKDVKGAAESKKLVVGFDKSYPPYGFVGDDGEYTGFDLDLAKAVADKQGWEVKYEAIDWDAKVLELNSGSVDVLWNGVSITEERKQEMDFSRPYLANQQVIIVKADSDIADIASLAGKIVGLQKGSSALDALNKNEIASQVASVQEYADNVTALTDLSIGRLDAVVLDEVVARYYETKEAGTYKVLDEAFAAEEYGVGFKKGNTDLEEKVQKAFDEMIADGTAAKISEKWFGKDIIVKP